MKFTIIGPATPIPPVGWGAVESLIWDYKVTLEKLGHQVQIINISNPKEIIHRVNECDIKRDKSINIEPLLVKTMKIADHVIFISKWLQNYFIKKYSLNLSSYSYILNGCNKILFFPLLDFIIKLNKLKLSLLKYNNEFNDYNK